MKNCSAESAFSFTGRLNEGDAYFLAVSSSTYLHLFSFTWLIIASCFLAEPKFQESVIFLLTFRCINSVMGGIVTQQALGSVDRIQKARQRRQWLKVTLDTIHTKRMNLHAKNEEVKQTRQQLSQESKRKDGLQLDEQELTSQIGAFHAQDISIDDPDFKQILLRREELRERLILQAQLVDEKKEAAREAEATRDQMEIELSKLTEKESNYRAEARLLEREKALVAEYRITQEIKAAQAFKDRRESKITSLRKQAAELEERALKQIEEGKKASAVAQMRIKKKKQELRKARLILEEARQKRHYQRAQAFLQLKKSTEGVMASLRGVNEHAKRRRRIREKREKEEFEDILADGGNPYEVFRRRQVCYVLSIRLITTSLSSSPSKIVKCPSNPGLIPHRALSSPRPPI